jgi:hypothetical protein
MDNILSLRSERARLVIELDRVYETFQICRSNRCTAEMDRIARKINHLDSMLIGTST